MPIETGKLDKRIRIERLGTGTDDHGGESGTWSTLADRWAQVMNGTGRERREAAQETALAPATFRIRRCGVTGTVTAKDRLRFNPFGVLGAASPLWDINSVVPFGNDAIDITATQIVGDA